MTSLQNDPDIALVERRSASRPDSRSVAGFVPGPGIERLSLSLDIRALRDAPGGMPAPFRFHGRHAG